MQEKNNFRWKAGDAKKEINDKSKYGGKMNYVIV